MSFPSLTWKLRFAVLMFPLRHLFLKCTVADNYQIIIYIENKSGRWQSDRRLAVTHTDRALRERHRPSSLGRNDRK